MNIESIITAGLIVSFLNGVLIIMSTIIHRKEWRKHKNINIAALALFLSIGFFYYEYKSVLAGNNTVALTFITFFLFSFSVSMFVKSLASLYDIKSLINIKLNILIAVFFATLITLSSYYSNYALKFFLYNASIMIPMAFAFQYLVKCKMKLYTNVFFYLIIFLFLVLLHNIVYASFNLVNVDYTNIPKRVVTWVMVAVLSLNMIYVAYIIEQNYIDLNKTRGNFELLQQLHNKVKKISETDHLTGLYNRHKITYILEQLSITKSEFSILICDVNDFKSINDRFGHLVGDEALVFTAKALESIVRSNDIVGRWGGDEFIVILPNTNNELSEVVRNKIVNCFNKETFEKIEEGLSLCIGCSTFSQNDSLKETINRADLNMYTDKKKYRSLQE